MSGSSGLEKHFKEMGEQGADTKRNEEKKDNPSPRQKKEYGHGRADPDGKIQAAIRKLKDKGFEQALIPYRSEILKLLPNKDASADRSMSPKEYLINTGKKLSTIKNLAREIYKN